MDGVALLGAMNSEEHMMNEHLIPINSTGSGGGGGGRLSPPAPVPKIRKATLVALEEREEEMKRQAMKLGGMKKGEGRGMQEEAFNIGTGGGWRKIKTKKGAKKGKSKKKGGGGSGGGSQRVECIVYTESKKAKAIDNAITSHMNTNVSAGRGDRQNVGGDGGGGGNHGQQLKSNEGKCASPVQSGLTQGRPPPGRRSFVPPAVISTYSIPEG
ncbi:hypothetical protein TrRE_jg807, partial [Triparma retinervis]